MLGFGISAGNDESWNNYDIVADNAVVHISTKFDMVVVYKWASVVANIESQVADMAMTDRLMGMMAAGNMSLF